VFHNNLQLFSPRETPSQLTRLQRLNTERTLDYLRSVRGTFTKSIYRR